MGEDYYKLLEIEKGASEDDIIKSWKRLSKKYHPDKNHDKVEWADEMQKKINEAKNVLIDPQKRRVYDQFGEEGLKGGQQSSGFDNFENIFGKFFTGRSGFNGNGDIFGNMFPGFFGNVGNGNFRREKSNPKRVIEVPLTLEDVYKGYSSSKTLKIGKECQTCEGFGKKYITVCNGCEGKGFRVVVQQLGPGMISQTQNVCRDCNGKKKVGFGDGICDNCKGEKTIEKILNIEITFKPGVENGTIFQKTEEEIDFQFVVKVVPHHVYNREGNNLRFRKEISLFEALCGVEFSLKLLDEREIIVKSKEVIQPNTEYSIKRLGINGGNILINFHIIFPTIINENDKKKLAKIFDITPEKNKNDELSEIYYI